MWGSDRVLIVSTRDSSVLLQDATHTRTNMQTHNASIYLICFIFWGFFVNLHMHEL